MQKFVDHYCRLRASDVIGGGKTAYRITVRQLESMIRLAEALARLHLDPIVGQHATFSYFAGAIVVCRRSSSTPEQIYRACQFSRNDTGGNRTFVYRDIRGYWQKSVVALKYTARQRLSR